ncbi:MAG: STAS domain-containing protein [Candidatus Promineifilaceae bacterium]|jgi:anti-anti-sigma factor
MMSIMQLQLIPCLWLIEVEGRLDQSQTPELEKILKQLQNDPQCSIIVDFSQATYINSGGLRCLLTSSRLAKSQGGDVVLCGLKARITEIFDMVGLNHVFTIYSTRGEAVDHFDSLQSDAPTGNSG